MRADEPVPTPETTDADELAERRRRQMLDLAVRHLYGTALTLCRLTGGALSDVPRILVAASAHSVTTLIDKLALQQQRLADLGPDDPTRGVIERSSVTLAADVNQTVEDFEAALVEALTNLKALQTPEEGEPQ